MPIIVGNISEILNKLFSKWLNFVYTKFFAILVSRQITKGVKMNRSNQIVILSAELSTLSKKQNFFSTELLEQMLTDCNFNFIPAIGSYKGTQENSFVVMLTDSADIEVLRGFAAKFNQDSILYIDSNGLSTLLYGDNTSENIPTPRFMCESEALNKDAWTKIGSNYYA